MSHGHAESAWRGTKSGRPGRTGEAVAVTDNWHDAPRHVKGADLSGDTGQTTGIRRLEVISGKTVGSSKVWMGRTRVGPHTNSGDHHHGEAETAIDVVSGNPSFVFADRDDEVRIDTEPGDHIFVPAVRAAPRGEPDRRGGRRGDRARQPGGIVVNLPSL